MGDSIDRSAPARQHGEMAMRERVTDFLLETIRELIQTSGRAAVEQIVCERLADSDLYQFAWIGERGLDGDRIVPRITAGEDGAHRDAVSGSSDDTIGRELGSRAMHTGEVQVVTGDEPSIASRHWSEKDRGLESIAAVPLCHGGTVYGVLVVYTTREDAFGERERAGFDVLGRAVASVIYAAKSRKLLYTDAVVELEFRFTDPEPLFVRAVAGVDCELELEGYIASGERWILYVAVDSAAPDAVVETASDEARIERARIVSGGDDPLVELVIGESSVLDVLTAAGANLRTAATDPDGAHIVVEVPVDVDTREIVEHVQREYPGAELVTCSEHDQDVTVVGRPGGLLDDLTDRQREALGAAYRAGYFAWPRESTAEEVAEALDIAPSTLHGHLRKAEEVLLSALLEDSSQP